MEDKGIYEVVEIPDTPDRLSARHVSHGNFRGKEQVVSVAGHLSFTKEGRPQQPMNGSGLGSENDRSGRRCTHLPSRTLIDLDEFNHISDDASENLHSPQNSRVFKRTIPGRNSKNEERLNVSTEYLDKGKKLCYEVPQKSSCAKDIGLSDFSLPNRHSQMIETAFASGASNNIADDKKKGREVAREASSRAPDSIMTSSCAYKGKEKVVEYSGKGYGAAKDHVKQVDQINNSHGKLVKEISMPTTSAISVGTNGRKRLVRNGCISPHNIAIRGRQIAECNRTNPENGNINGTSNEIGHSAQCPVDITDIIADNKDGTRVSGRGTDFHLSTVNGGRAAHHPSNVRDRDGIPWRSNTASGCIMDSRNMEQTITGNDISSVECAISRNHTAQRDSLLLSDSNQISMPSHDASFLGKRQKKYGATNKNRGQSSTSVPKDSEIVCTDSYRVSRNSRPSGLRSSRTQHPVIEVDDLSPVIRHSHSQSAWSVDNDNTIARASQIEADEMLARELQEQLYYEDPVGSAGEVDEHIAWALQLEERATNTASRERQVLQYPRAPSHRQPRLQPQSHPFCNTSHRSGSQPRAPSSSRMAQLRNRFRRQSPALPRGEHLLEFPFDMDLDMRIDILEALEAADGDLDMGLDNHLLQFQQNFNVNDYETLLALDENSHHAGASGSQINSLPLSTVQTENFETCAICLEAPSIGETVRHLPCLHKFHKDCIDPWLSRKTSCPVCKSSIT